MSSKRPNSEDTIPPDSHSTTTTTTPYKRPRRTSLATPGIYRPLFPQTPRPENSPSAFDTFPAREFDTWIDSIKRKARAALDENLALEATFQREKLVEEQVAYRNVLEREKVAAFMRRQARVQEEERWQILARRSLASEVTYGAGAEIGGPEYTASEDDAGRDEDDESDARQTKDGFIWDESHDDRTTITPQMEEDDEDEHETEEEETVEEEEEEEGNYNFENAEEEGGQGSSLISEEEVNEESEDDYEEEPTFLSQAPARPLPLLGKTVLEEEEEEDDSLSGTMNSNDEQQSGEDGHNLGVYEEGDEAQQNEAEEEEEVEEEEEEQVQEFEEESEEDEHRPSSAVEILSSDDESENVQPEGLLGDELNEAGLHDDELFGPGDDDFDSQDDDAFETELSARHQGTLQTDGDEVDHTAGPTMNAEIAHPAPLAPRPQRLAEPTPGGAADTRHAWLGDQEDGTLLEGGTQEIPSFVDSMDHDFLDDAQPDLLVQPSVSLEAHPQEQPAFIAQYMESDAPTEEEIEDEMYHMWKDDIQKSDGLAPIEEEPAGVSFGPTEEIENDRGRDVSAKVSSHEAEKGSASPELDCQTESTVPAAPTSSINHTHPSAHPGHEHEHHAHTIETTTEDFHPEELPVVSKHEILDETERNFDVRKDKDDVPTSVAEKTDAFDEPMTEGEVEALGHEVHFLEELERQRVPTDPWERQDDLQEFPEDLVLEDESEDGSDVSDQVSDSGNLDDFHAFAEESEDASAGEHESEHESDSESESRSSLVVGNHVEDPEIIEDEGSIDYESGDASVEYGSDAAEGNESPGSVSLQDPGTRDAQEDGEDEEDEEDEEDKEDKEDEEDDSKRLDFQVIVREDVPHIPSPQEPSGQDEASQTMSTTDVVHVLRDGVEYVDPKDDEHHYTPLLRLAVSTPRRRRRSRTPQR